MFIGVLLTALGAIYTEQKEYDKALEYLMQAKDTYEIANMKVASSLANNIGYLYNALKNHPEALKWYLEGIKIEEATDAPTEELVRLYDNAGIQYVKTKDYSNGMKFLFKALSMQLNKGDDNGAAFTYGDIGSAFLLASTEKHANLPDSLRNKSGNLQKALFFLHRSEDLDTKLRIPTLEETLYNDLSKAYELMGDYRNSKLYFEKYAQVRYTLRDFAREKEFAKVEAMYLFQKKTDSLKLLNTLKDEELHQKKLERNGGILFIALIGIISVLLINRRSLRHQQKTKLAETEVRHTKEIARKQLDTFTQSIQEKNELIEKFTVELERYQALPCSNELPNSAGRQKELMNSVILTEEQWGDFQVLFESVHAGYISRVNKKFEGLTAAELRFVLLTRLGMSNKEMAAMLGVGYEAIRVVKHRVLKKVQLPDGKSLEEAVLTI